MLRCEYKKEHIIVRIFGIKLSIKISGNCFFTFMRLLDLIIPKKKNRIVFCIDYRQMGASIMYYKYLKENHSEKYEIIPLINSKKYHNINYLFTAKNIFKALSAKYIVITNSNDTLELFESKRHIYLNLWHGMPVKKLGLMKELGKRKQRLYKFLANNAAFFVTSDIFKHIMISAFQPPYDKVYITGNARNDLIGLPDNDDKLKQIFDLDQYSKVILYMPTYKFGSKKNLMKDISKEFNNIFYLDDYNENDFVKILEDNNILFLMKPHPIEAYFYTENTDILPKTENFRIIVNEDFYSNDIQPYEIFKFVDLMISDYSSAALDYLILNRPVIYLNNLAEDYNSNRGMVLEDNYEILMPGVKVLTYKDFEKQLIENLYNDTYKQERERLLPLIHKYRDFNSSERIFKVMERL